MTACPRCGGPMAALFTSIYCAAECDKRPIVQLGWLRWVDYAPDISLPLLFGSAQGRFRVKWRVIPPSWSTIWTSEDLVVPNVITCASVFYSAVTPPVEWAREVRAGIETARTVRDRLSAGNVGTTAVAWAWRIA